MSIFGQLAAGTKRVLTTLSSWLGSWGTGGGGGTIQQIPTADLAGGTHVTLALQSSAVWACCRVVSQAVASLPAHIYEHTGSGKQLALSHPYYRLLTVQPNPLMTVMSWLQTTVLHLMLYGNAYTIPERNAAGGIVALWPVTPERIRVTWTPAGGYVYLWTNPKGQQFPLTAADLLHFRVFSLDGIVGLSPIMYQRLSFDIEAASRIYSWGLYMNSGRPGGVLEYPGQLNEAQIKNIRDSWKQVHGGPQNAGNVVVLEGGVKYSALSISPEQLEYVAQQKFSVEQIARIFGVPPHLIGAMDKPTYASVEQQGLEFQQYTLQTIVTSLEKTIGAALLEDKFYMKLNLAAFERSDIATRFRAYATARQWGWMSVNDIRSKEDDNGIGPDGDIYLQPMNMVQAGEQPPPVAGADAGAVAGADDAGAVAGPNTGIGA
jgi:HK97 family phage portal protein